MSVIEANMAMHQSKKQSDLEKRLKILRQQFYGKSPEKSTVQYVSKSDRSDSLIHPHTDVRLSSDTAYLNQDLLKIFTFASVALGAQFILFFLVRNHILNLKFF